MTCKLEFYTCKTFSSGKTRLKSCSLMYRVTFCLKTPLLAELQKCNMTGKKGKWKHTAATWHLEAEKSTLCAREWKKSQMAKYNIWGRNKRAKKLRAWLRKYVILKIANILKTEVRLYLYYRTTTAILLCNKFSPAEMVWSTLCSSGL